MKIKCVFHYYLMRYLIRYLKIWPSPNLQTYTYIYMYIYIYEAGSWSQYKSVRYLIHYLIRFRICYLTRYLIRYLIRYLSNLNRLLKLSKFDQTFDVVMDSLHVTPNVGVMLKSYCSFILMIHMLACVWWFWKVLSQSKVREILGFTYSLLWVNLPI